MNTNQAWALTVVTGRTRIEVIEAYGGDPSQKPQVLAFASAQVSPEELGEYTLVQIKEAGGHVVAIENNGWRGKAIEVAERASSRGAALVSVFWNLNANYKLTAAVDGKPTASFDPLTVQHPAPSGRRTPTGSWTWCSPTRIYMPSCLRLWNNKPAWPLIRRG